MDATTTVEVNGWVYQIGRLNPRKSFHVTRRLAPFLGAILPHLKALFAKGTDDDMPSRDEFFDRIGAIAPSIADILARLSNDDVDYILDTCLAVVSIKQDRGWAPVFSNGVIMFDFIDMKTMLQLTSEVIKANLSDFFPSPQRMGSETVATMQ